MIKTKPLLMLTAADLMSETLVVLPQDMRCVPRRICCPTVESAGAGGR